jgi:hypothetical protein
MRKVMLANCALPRDKRLLAGDAPTLARQAAGHLTDEDKAIRLVSTE